MIETNDMVKMRIKLQAKPQIWNMPHYYLCWEHRGDKNDFFIITSNFFKLFADGIANADDIVSIAPRQGLPLVKLSYMILNETYTIQNFHEKPKMLKFSNCVTNKQLLQYQERGKLAKQLIIKDNEYELI